MITTMKTLGCSLLLLAALWSLEDVLARQDSSPRFAVGVNIVSVRMTVTDPVNRYVVGLEGEHFSIFEDKVEQTLSHFFSNKAPISVGIILDVSGSMKDKIASAHGSVVRFLEGGNEGDEYFLIAFNERGTVVQDFTSGSKDVRNRVAISTPKGRTALYDAIYLGLEKMRQAQQGKQALIIITDGEDNSSRYTFSEVREFAKESDVQIYVIGERSELGYGRAIIAQIGQLTGGRAFFPRNLRQLDYFIDLIHAELRHQYVLGYIPNNTDFDGEWRKIKIRINPPEGLPKLTVRAKEGYYPPRRFTNPTLHR